MPEYLLKPDQQFVVTNMTWFERLKFRFYMTVHYLMLESSIFRGVDNNNKVELYKIAADSSIIKSTGGKVLDGRLFKVERKIGEGAFGEVYKCIRPLGDVVAVKKIKRKDNDEKDIERWHNEFMIMHTCARFKETYFDNNFVLIHGWHIMESGFYLSMEYCQNGSLEDNMNKNGRGLELKYAYYHAVSLIFGLDKIHSIGIIHRDLKPSNVLLWKQPNGYAHMKIADFGLSKFFGRPSGQSVDENAEHTQCVGSFHYMAPEVYDGMNYSKKADVYSLGKTIAYMCVGPELEKMPISVDKCGFPIFSKYPQRDTHTTLVGQMMCENKDQRPELRDILNASDVDKCIFKIRVIRYCPAPCNRKLASADGTVDLF